MENIRDTKKKNVKNKNTEKTVTKKEKDYRKVDDLGRVTIPIEYRKKYDFSEHSKVDFDSVKGGLLLKKVYDECIFCGAKDILSEYKEKMICQDCRKDLR